MLGKGIASKACHSLGRQLALGHVETSSAHRRLLHALHPELLLLICTQVSGTCELESDLPGNMATCKQGLLQLAKSLPIGCAGDAHPSSCGSRANPKGLGARLPMRGRRRASVAHRALSSSSGRRHISEVRRALSSSGGRRHIRAVCEGHLSDGRLLGRTCKDPSLALRQAHGTDMTSWACVHLTDSVCSPV